MKYIIVTTFLIIGFQHIHLSKLVTYFIVTLGFSIGWVLKDPLADFAYYFILLIQRPLKIGDYILIDEEVQGVVRKITPRSVIIRKKNSETILVHHQIMEDYHLDFSKPWPLYGFLHQ